MNVGSLSGHDSGHLARRGEGDDSKRQGHLQAGDVLALAGLPMRRCGREILILGQKTSDESNDTSSTLLRRVGSLKRK